MGAAYRSELQLQPEDGAASAAQRIALAAEKLDSRNELESGVRVERRPPHVEEPRLDRKWPRLVTTEDPERGVQQAPADLHVVAHRLAQRQIPSRRGGADVVRTGQ